MSDSRLEEIQRKMLEAEEELIDKFSNYSLDELLATFAVVSYASINDMEPIKRIIKNHSEYSKEAIFSSFRILKSALAEVEYRIRENKI